MRIHLTHEIVVLVVADANAAVVVFVTALVVGIMIIVRIVLTVTVTVIVFLKWYPSKNTQHQSPIISQTSSFLLLTVII